MSRLTTWQIGAIAIAALAVGITSLTAGINSDHSRAAAIEASTGAVTGWAFIAAGIVAWQRRPENRFGLLMVVVGFFWFIRGLEDANHPQLFTIGLLLDGAALAALVHALALYPSGRFDWRFGPALVALAYFDAVVLQVVQQLFNDTLANCTNCPDNLALAWPSTMMNDRIELVQGPIIGGLLAAGTVAMLVRRWRRSSVLRRQALTPVLISFSIFAAVFLSGLIIDVSGGDDSVVTALFVTGGLVMVAIPLVFLAGLLQRRLSRAAVAALVVDLSTGDPTPERVERLIAEALGDRTLRLLYARPDGDGYLDGAGAPAALPSDDPQRAWRSIESSSGTIGALVFDSALTEEPDLVDGVTAATAFALENARLQAELRAQLIEVRASRARIVEAADTERRRLERNLHDGAQQRLLSLGIALRLLRDRVGEDQAEAVGLLDEADAEVRGSIEELRELARGLHPTVLTDEGLEPALTSLAARAPLPVTLDVSLSGRLPASAEAAAYYVVSEAITNAAKHAQASGVTVELREQPGQAHVAVSDDGVGGADANGSGLRGLADRVASLDGEFHVTSPAGGGTAIEAVIPCAS